jgi:fused signal recognition particle receptor
MFSFFKSKDSGNKKTDINFNDLKLTKQILEERLIEADIQYDLIEEILENLPNQVSYNRLKETIMHRYNHKYSSNIKQEKPFVEIIVGTNGVGKTTTLAKLAYRYKNSNKSIIIGAADTFRAAAIEQLKQWAIKLNIDIVSTKQGHDPSSVAFDTISKAISKNIDNVIIDTAGRLHTNSNLAKELQKIVRICNKAKSGSPHRKLIVIDGTQSSSAFNQVALFDSFIKLDGIIVTKLDGTASGGAILSILKLNIPILYIGIGEKQDDLREFDLDDFVTNLLKDIFL